MKRAAWLGIGVVALGAVGVIGAFVMNESAPPPERKPERAPFLDPAKKGKIDPNTYAQERLRQGLLKQRRGALQLRQPGITVEAIDSVLARRTDEIETCLKAASVHGEVPTPLPMTLRLVPDQVAEGLKVDTVGTAVGPELDQCLANALQTDRFEGNKPLAARVTWPLE